MCLTLEQVKPGAEATDHPGEAATGTGVTAANVKWNSSQPADTIKNALNNVHRNPSDQLLLSPFLWWSHTPSRVHFNSTFSH